jgi:hypothetical protein
LILDAPHISQQTVSADITKNSSVGNIMQYVDSLPKDFAEIETGMAEKSSPGTRQTDGKNLFGLEK